MKAPATSASIVVAVVLSGRPNFEPFMVNPTNSFFNCIILLLKAIPTLVTYVDTLFTPIHLSV
jgi:hypothetical protein